MRERGRGWSESNPGRGEGGLVRRGGKGSLFSVRALGIPHVVDLQLQLLDADVPLVEHLPQTPDLLLLLVELQTQLVLCFGRRAERGVLSVADRRLTPALLVAKLVLDVRQLQLAWSALGPPSAQGVA